MSYPELLKNVTAIDFGTLTGALPETKIFPTDTDGLFFVEKKGKMMVLETKFKPALSEGQRRLLSHLSTLPNTDVYLFVVSASQKTSVGAYHFHPWLYVKIEPGLLKPYEPIPYQQITLDKFREIYRQWYEEAIK